MDGALVILPTWMFYCRHCSEDKMLFCTRGMVLCCKWHKGESRPLDCLKTFSINWRRGLATGMPTMCNPLEHTEYLHLQTNLRKEKVLGPFEQVCLYILDIDIKVIIGICRLENNIMDFTIEWPKVYPS